MKKTTRSGETVNGEAFDALKQQPQIVSSRIRKELALLCATAAALCLPGHSAQAAAYDWIGATNATWDSGWTGANVPTTSDDLTILGPSNAPGALTIDVFANAFANTISFTDTSAVGLANTSGADRTLTIQSGLTTGTGAVTIGSASANQGVLIALGASQTWTIGTGGVTANNAISGATFGITKSGTGTLTLNGTNTYTGATSITAGTLQLGTAGAWSTNAGNTLTVDAGTFKFAGPTALTVNQNITVGTNGAMFDGSGTTQGSSALTLGATNTPNSIAYSGTAASRTITLAGTYQNGEATTNFFNYRITDDGTPGDVTNLSKIGTGNWQLNAANTYSGTTTISGGVLSTGVTNALPTTTGVTLSSNGTLNLVGAANQTIATLNSASVSAIVEDTNGGNGSTTGVLTVTGTGTYAGVISQRANQFARTVSFTKSGTGTLTLTNNNTYAGGTQVTGGTLAITKDKGLGTGVAGNLGATNTNITTVSGGTLDLNGGISAIVVNEALTLNGGNLVNNSTTNAATLDNGVASILVTNKGAGGATAASVSFGGSPTTAATGTVSVNAGLTTFLFTAGSGYTTAPTVTVTATLGTFTTTPTATAVLSSLTLTGTSNTIGGAGNLTINAVVGGAGGGFSKTGNGTLTMNGINTYTGSTTVTAGTLLVSGGLTATSDLAVSGGTLRLGASDVLNSAASLTLSGGTLSTGATTGFNETLGALDLNTAGTLTLALGTGVHSLNFANSSAIDWTGSTLTITGWTGTAGSSGTDGKIFFGNSASGLTSGQLSQINFSGYANGATILSTGEIVAVPEPSTWALLAFSLTTVMVLRRRQIT